MSEATTREFEFVEGTSNKFWKITVAGTTHTVHYGRVGTAGQVQTKEFDSGTAAKTAGDKLIAEKLKKGYHETTSGVTTAIAVVEPKAAAAPSVVEDVNEQNVEPISVVRPSPEKAFDPSTIVRSLKLTEDDYIAAGLKPRRRKTAPEPPTFERKSVVSRIVQAAKDRSSIGVDFPLDRPMSHEEAYLWLHMYFTYRNGVLGISSERRHSDLMSLPIANKPDLKPLIDLIGFSTPALIFRVIAREEFILHLLSWMELVKQYNSGAGVIERIANNILPYLSEADIEKMREALIQAPGDTKPFSSKIAILHMLGEREMVMASVQNISPSSELSMYSALTGFILALGDSDFVSREIRRINLGLTVPSDARGWLAHTQTQGLDLIDRCLDTLNDKTYAESMVKAAGRMVAPETAPYMLKWLTAGKAIAYCRQWMDENPTMVAVGLSPLLVGDDPKLAELASSALKSLVKRGHEDIVRACLHAYTADQFERVAPPILETAEVETRYEPLTETECPPQLRPGSGAGVKAKPGDLLPDELPAIVVALDHGPRSLTEAQFYTLLHALAKSIPSQPQPYVTAVKDAATHQSRDAFAWALFQEWIASGALPKDKWKLFAIGLLGSDQCALKLTPLIRQWPGESQHVRAKLGIECLEAIGTDTALMQINGIAQKVPFKALKEAAIKCMEGIAKKRGLTRPELEDRIVPDCGLDERGSRVFDFGPRQFALSVNSDMKPVLRELKDGNPLPKLLTDLPKPNLKDDPTKSEDAVTEWKTLKKQVAETAKIQAIRLEQGMVIGRRWSAEEFDMLLVHHPLMTNIVRLLLWGIFGEDGKLIQSFRITEDLTAADASDDVYAIPSDAKIGVVHPLQLSDAEKNAWGEIWSDYELVPPFPQLGRPIYALTSEEAEVTNLKRFSSVTLPAATLIFTLEKLSWLRGVPADAGGFNEHAKPFYAAGVTAIVNYDPGSYVSYITESDDQKITEVYFIPRIYTPDELWPAHKKRVPWKEIDPVVVSEVLADLTFVVAKAK